MSDQVGPRTQYHRDRLFDPAPRFLSRRRRSVDRSLDRRCLDIIVVFQSLTSTNSNSTSDGLALATTYFYEPLAITMTALRTAAPILSSQIAGPSRLSISSLRPLAAQSQRQISSSAPTTAAESPKYPGHVPLSFAQNALLAVGSGVVGVLDPTRGGMSLGTNHGQLGADVVASIRLDCYTIGVDGINVLALVVQEYGGDSRRKADIERPAGDHVGRAGKIAITKEGYTGTRMGRMVR